MPLYSFVIFRRIAMFHFGYIEITQKYNNTNYTVNMMIVHLEDKTKEIYMDLQIVIYFIMIFLTYHCMRVVDLRLLIILW
jgi:hypothetical protein